MRKVQNIMTDPLTDFIENNTSHLIRDVTDDTKLLSQGLLDSLLLMNLLAFLERKYGIQIPDEEIVPENFETPRAIRSLISRLATAQQASPRPE